MRKIIVLCLCVALLTVLIISAVVMEKAKDMEPIEDAGVAKNAVVERDSITYHEKEYPIKSHLQTILLIGTDGTEGYQEKTEGIKRFYNYNQADFLMLLVLNHDENTAEILQLNRDTMTDVPWLDVLGNYGGTEYKQLCLAFNYGDGGVKSCKNTINAVSSLLFDAPIESYIQIPMSAIGVLNDLVGGVPVTIEEDMTQIDPAFTAGSIIWLDGTQAEKFVRARKAMQDDTNLARMRRQRQYLDSFQKRARESMNSDSDFMVKILGKLSEFLQSNLTAQELSDLIKYLDTAIISPIHYAEGELKKGEQYYEFYPNDDSLWQMVRGAYCK